MSDGGSDRRVSAMSERSVESLQKAIVSSIAEGNPTGVAFTRQAPAVARAITDYLGITEEMVVAMSRALPKTIWPPEEGEALAKAVQALTLLLKAGGES